MSTSTKIISTKNLKTIEKSTTKEIAKILGLQSDFGFSVTDMVTTTSGNTLYMVHYKSDANLEEFGHLRGTVVDLKNKKVISRPYGYAPTVITSRLVPNPKTGELKLQDMDQKFHTLASGRYNILPGFEGVVIQVFMYEGKVYHATHKKFDISKSKWADSPFFSDLWSQLAAPKDEELFDLTKKFSPYCHLFLLIHPSLLYVTKDYVGSGYTVYIGPKIVWNPKESSYPDVDDKLHQPKFQSELDSERKIPVLYSPSKMNIETANGFLATGFYKAVPTFWYNPVTQIIQPMDDRLLPGEKLFVQKLDESGKIIGTLEIHSRSYAWRDNIRDNHANMKFRFYELLNSANNVDFRTNQGILEYTKRFPVLPRLNVNDVVNMLNSDVSILTWPAYVKIPHPQFPMTLMDIPLAGNPNDLLDKADRLYNNWVCFIMAVPLNRQKEVSGYYQDLISDREKLVKWLYGFSVLRRNNPTEWENINETNRMNIRIKPILDVSEKDAIKHYPSDNVGDQGLESKIQLNIKNLIFKEYGNSLYNLSTNMRKYAEGRTKIKSKIAQTATTVKI